jgi:ribosome maturation factor RimP
MGFFSPFFICGETMELALDELLESTLQGMGYELVEVEQLARNRLIRIFVDKKGGINIDDCVVISNHLSHLLAVENIDYGRLEVSSPGLDRLLRKEADFLRYIGETIKLKLRTPLKGQRNFVGILREVNNGIIKLEIEGVLLNLELSNLEKTRLVPKL